VARWVHEYRAQAKSALRKAGRAGRQPRLREPQRQRLEKLLIADPEQLGYPTPLWTCPWVAYLIEQEFDVHYQEGQKDRFGNADWTVEPALDAGKLELCGPVSPNVLSQPL
jgi:transposase